MNSEIILEVKDLCYTYEDGTMALKQMNMKIYQGTKTIIMGGNGAGKSTLFLNMNGILAPNSGTIYFKGQPISYNRKAIHYLREKIGIVFQDPEQQIFSSSIYQELAFGPENFSFSKERTTKNIKAVMARFELDKLADKPVHFLSYGQKKQVAIASILVLEPEVLILDEPTAGLDPYHIKQMLQMLEEVHKQGVTIIIATHDVDFAYNWANDIHIIKEGKHLDSGNPKKIFRDSALLEAANLEQPYLIEIMDKLYGGVPLADEDIPRNIDGLINIIKGEQP